MKIGVRLGRNPSGGMAAFVRNLGAAIERIGGHEVVFVCMGEAWPDLGGSQVTFGAKGQFDEYRLDAGKVGAWCSSNGVDVLLCPGNQVSRTDQRTVWWPLTVAPFEQLALDMVAEGRSGRVRWQAVQKSLSISARLADRVVFSSNYARALYGAGVGEALRSKPTEVIPPTTSIRVTGRSESSEPFILSVSNFNRYKFVEEMVAGFGKSEVQAQGWKLKLVGRFPVEAYEARVHQKIQQLGLQDCVDVVGEIASSELPELYSKASAFMFASVSENAASYTVIDALAYGLPTISSFYSSTPEILGNAVRYMDPFSPANIASNLDALIDPQERSRLSQCALDQAREFPTWDTVAERLISFAS